MEGRTEIILPRQQRHWQEKDLQELNKCSLKNEWLTMLEGEMMSSVLFVRKRYTETLGKIRPICVLTGLFEERRHILDNITF